MTEHFFTAYIERDGVEIEVEVTCTVSAYYAATHLQPAEGGEIEVESVKYKGIELAGLTVAENEKIIVDITDHQINRFDDEADARHEQARDRHMDDEWECNQ